MKVLITGGAGLIGSHIAEALLARGDEVLVLDDFTTGRRGNVPKHERLTLVEGSIADQGTVERAFTAFGPDKVVHAAASYKDPTDWVSDTLTNALGAVHVVKAALRVGVQRLVYFQTALCYGNNPKEQPITLDHPRWPDCSYAISKTAAEEYIESSGLDYVTFRLANIIGPRNLSGPVPTFFKRLSAGQPCFVSRTRRDFVFVGDLVELTVAALAGGGASGTYHASSGRDFAIQELYDLVASALGNDDPVEVRDPAPDDALTILLDPSRTEAEFGWRATTPLADSVGRAVAWYRQHGLEETYTHLKLEPTQS